MKKIIILIMIYLYLFACSSDFDCGFGKVCVKKPFSSNGVCMKEVDEYGTPQYSSPKLNSIKPRMNDDGCSFDTDCRLGLDVIEIIKFV